MITLQGLFKSSEYRDWRANKSTRIRDELLKRNVEGDKDKYYKLNIEIVIATRKLHNRYVARLEIDNVAKTIIDTLAMAGIFGGRVGEKIWDSNVREIDVRIEKMVENSQNEMVSISIYHKSRSEGGEWEEIPTDIKV